MLPKPQTTERQLSTWKRHPQKVRVYTSQQMPCSVHQFKRATSKFKDCTWHLSGCFWETTVNMQMAVIESVGAHSIALFCLCSVVSFLSFLFGKGAKHSPNWSRLTVTKTSSVFEGDGIRSGSTAPNAKVCGPLDGKQKPGPDPTHNYSLAFSELECQRVR